MAHVLDASTVRVVFETPVDETALRPGAYSLQAVSAAWNVSVPPAAEAAFFDADRTSVSVTFLRPLTLGAVYSMQLQGIRSEDGRTSSTSTYNFSATVPSPPRAVGAFLSERGCLDIVFDRPVRDSTAAGASAQLVSVDTGVPADMAQVPPHPGLPPENLQFFLPFGMSPGASFTVNFQNAVDESFNVGSGSVPLTLRLQAPVPYTYGALLRPQMTDAFVDRVSQTAGRAFLNVFFSCPMLGTDVQDTSKWVVTKDGVHVGPGSTPLADPDPVDDTSFVTFAQDACAAYNAHLSVPGVHKADAAFPAQSSIAIRLINDLRTKFNQHVPKAGVHTVSDAAHLVSEKAAIDEAGAVALVARLKARFNQHRTAVSGAFSVHLADDVDNVVTTADPSTFQQAAALADELRTKLELHVLGKYHAVADSSDRPSAAYCLSRTVASVATVNDAYGALNELQAKFAVHAASELAHAYSDDTYGIPYVTIVLDTPGGCVVAAGVKSLYNEHVLGVVPVAVDGVVLDATDADSASSAYSFYAQLRVKAVSAFPSYQVQAALRCEDGSSATSVLDFSGNVVARSVLGRPTLLSSTVLPSGAELRFDREILIPRTEDVSLSRAGGAPVNVTYVRLRTSLQALAELLSEDMVTFRSHLSEVVSAGVLHASTDTSDYITDDRLPGPDESQVVAAANYFKARFNAHVAGAYHAFTAASDAVSLPDATDLDGASVLAEALSAAIRAHRKNRSAHYADGPVLGFAKMHDVLEIGYEGLLDGALYSLRAGLQYKVRDARHGDYARPFELELDLRGVADPPFVASALPVSAVGDAGLGRDVLSVFFSKPMREGALASGSVHVTGPAGLIVGPSLWSGPRVLTSQVRGMVAAAQYSIDVEDVADEFGNAVQPYSPPVPPPPVPFIPNSCIQDIVLSQDLNFGDSVQASMDVDCMSVTFNDGRAAAYFRFTVPDAHMVIAEVFGPVSGYVLQPLQQDTVVNILRPDRTVAATNSDVAGASVVQVQVNLAPGTYLLEVTAGAPGQVEDLTVTVGTLCHGASGPGGVYFGAVGVGCPSTSVPSDFAGYVSFVADSVHVTCTLSGAPGMTLVVHDGTDSGTVLGSGATGVPVGFVTAPGSTYVLEVHTPDPGPANYSVAILDA